MASTAVGIYLDRESQIKLLTVATNQTLQKEVVELQAQVAQMREGLKIYDQAQVEYLQQSHYLSQTNSQLSNQVGILTEQGESLLAAYQKSHESHVAAIQQKFDLQIELANLNIKSASDGQ